MPVYQVPLSLSVEVVTVLNRVVAYTGQDVLWVLARIVDDAVGEKWRFHVHSCELVRDVPPGASCTHCHTPDGRMGKCLICDRFVSTEDQECICGCHRFKNGLGWPF